MKKILLKTAVLIITVFILSPALANAADPPQTDNKVNIDELIFQTFWGSDWEDTTWENRNTLGEEAVGALPDNISAESVMSAAIKIILQVAMFLVLIGIIVSAIYYVISLGNEDNIAKAKNIILYLVVGMVIIMAAYGIVTGLAQFEFFVE